ncbi:MAG TPA: M1 family metallopeptidase [Ferruginibacter sp.]|nr:M1 family metallopeptidase [Ferruginibacter sp.]HRO18540.1 M1 family metallopeptidase [Ferruginibacter sp.]HRQ21743.1 M1 family metallopeptidase [Ferruginibacter sp.]
MKQIIVAIVFLTTLFSAQAQRTTRQDTTWKTIYRETPAQTHDLIHTKLDVRFDFDKAWMYGKEWLTIQPYFYPADSVVLDAKGMEIKEVSLITGATKKTLKHVYDGMQLTVYLDRFYKEAEKFTLYFEYISKPNELEAEGSAAIRDARGLYFINPKGDEKGKPTQIWTQGETEASSVWFITIDKPNQNTTQELAMTVPDKYVTLSNGLMTSQKKNIDGTRTDTWKLDIPHAPYLFFMGVGEYDIIKDKPYKGKEISYYVEKEYAPYAKGIFGHTAEMIQFYENYTGFPYIWPKYAQIVSRDYVSGAMENSTAVIHQETAYQNDRELADGNRWEETIAHEIFHHWFGNIVTTESWSNLTINESFANYSEYLWLEHKYGRDKADHHAYNDMMGYMGSGSEDKKLVRHHYANKEDMFDAVSYNKGGRILHMLRDFVGDSAFKKSLNHFLKTYQHKPVEATQLRLSFEEVTGLDLNWFFNQWYYGSGHPKMLFRYVFDDAAGKAHVITTQSQKEQHTFRLPVKVDVYYGDKKTRYLRWINKRTDTLTFDYTMRPTLINVDPERVLLADITDNKSEAQMIEQWKQGSTYLNRREAITFFAKNTMPEIAKGLTDKYAGIRLYTIQQIEKTPYKEDKVVLSTLEDMAATDPDKLVQAEALKYLAKLKNPQHLPLFTKHVTDISYSVSGAALKGIYSLDKTAALPLAKQNAKDARGLLGSVVTEILLESGTEADYDEIAAIYRNIPPSEEKLEQTIPYIGFLEKLSDLEKVKRGIDDIAAFRNMIPAEYRVFIDEYFKMQLTKLGKSKGKEIQQYIENAFK